MRQGFPYKNAKHLQQDDYATEKRQDKIIDKAYSETGDEVSDENNIT